MQKEHRITVCVLGLAAALFNAACPTTEAAPDSGDPDGATTGTNPLGRPCALGSECASGFCVESVCCDSTCIDTCYSCLQPGSIGACTAVRQGEDLVATSPCSGASHCFLDGAGIPGCKLQDKEPCSADDQCGSNLCRSYFRDADRDGYGVETSYIAICDAATALAPDGYALLAGDCCDSDSRANPAVATATYFSASDACGSFDWNCDGAVQRQTTMTCPGTGGAIACGASCYITALHTSTKVFTQLCR